MADGSNPALAGQEGDDRLEALLTDLVRGMRPGDRLPNERELSERFGVSRTAIRDRLGMLQGLGIVRRQTGSGTYVEKFSPMKIATALDFGISSAQIPLEELESVRVALEQQAACEATEKADPVLLAYMEKALIDMGKATTIEGRLAADQAFHRAMLRASENSALSFFADVLDGVLRKDLNARLTRAFSQAEEGATDPFVPLHAAILDAIRSTDRDAVLAAVRSHFEALDRVRAT